MPAWPRWRIHLGDKYSIQIYKVTKYIVGKRDLSMKLEPSSLYKEEGVDEHINGLYLEFHAASSGGGGISFDLIFARLT